jgi:hypothetical protein
MFDDYKIKLSNITLKVQPVNALAYIYGSEEGGEQKKAQS